MADLEESDSDFGSNIFTSYRKAEDNSLSLKQKGHSKNKRHSSSKRSKLTSLDSEIQKKSAHEMSTGSTSSYDNSRRRKPAVDVISDVTIPPQKYSPNTILKMKKELASDSDSSIGKYNSLAQTRREIDSDVETVRLNAVENHSDSDYSEYATEVTEGRSEASAEEEAFDSNIQVDDGTHNNSRKLKGTKIGAGATIREDGGTNRISSNELWSRSTIMARGGNSGSECETENLPSSTTLSVKRFSNNGANNTSQSRNRTTHQKIVKPIVSAGRHDISSSEAQSPTNKSTLTGSSEHFGMLSSDFISNSPDYKEVEFPEAASLLQLNEDDVEFFHLQMPENFNAKWLKGSNISLSGKTKINIEDGTFIVNPEVSKDPESLLVIWNRMKKIKPSKHFIMQKVKKVKKKKQSSLSSKTDVSFPCRLKFRHPALGANFAEKIQLKSVALEGLNEAIGSSGRHKRKLKSLKRKNTSVGETHIDDDKQEVIFEMLQTHQFEGSKRYKSLSSKKHKRRSSASYPVSFSQSEKKSKKSDSACEDTDSGIVDVKSEPPFSEIKDRRCSFVNSTFNINSHQQPNFNSEISRISIDNSPKEVKAKGKPKMKGLGNSLIRDILNSVKSELVVDGIDKKQKRNK